MIEQQLLDICNEFKADSSKSGKEALLKKYADNEDFKQYLIYILDPMYTYGLQDKKIKKFLGKVESPIVNVDIFKLFKFLSENPTGTDKIAENVAKYIKGLPSEELQRFALESITKKMKLGVTAKTVNKVYGKGFINNIEIMLAKKYEDEAQKIEGKEIVITEKYDGQRCVIIKEGNTIEAKSREAIPITGLVDIEKEIMMLPDGVYDGELLCYNHEQLKDRDILQETLKITRKDGNKTGVYFYIFDYLTLTEFDKGKSKGSYIERRNTLSEILSSVDTELKELVHVPVLYQGFDHSVIGDMIELMNAKGREGLMVNVADAHYECKRTHLILKVKTMQTADLRVIGFEKGKPLGKFENTLGKLIVDYKGYNLGVGGGFTDEERVHIWNNQDRYLGKIVEISYFRESTNADGGLSVSFPVYQGLRDDKTEPSYY